MHTSMQEAVNKYCAENKVLKKDFAKKIGVTPTKLSHWLSGRTRFSIQTLERVKAVIG